MRILVCAFTLCSAGLAAAERVHLEYTAVVATVSGDAFGLGVPRLTTVTGCFGYDTGAADSNSSPERGDYPLAAGGYFQARFLGHLLEGSNTPFLQVEDLSSDTFRFVDGKDILDRAGEMRLDGVSDPEFRLGLAITDGSGAAFGNDDLPLRFPFRMDGSRADLPHTFSLGSSLADRLLLQFTSLVQIPQPVLQIRRVDLAEDRSAADIEWISTPGERYRLEWSTTGATWMELAAGIDSQGGCTVFTDRLSLRFPEAVPALLFYRVHRQAPGP